MSDSAVPPKILLVGASRGIGLGMASYFAAEGWQVTATVRGDTPVPLTRLALANPGRVVIDTVDVTSPETIEALRGRLAERRFDMLFVNAGISIGGPADTFATTAPEDFDRMMRTNVFGAMRAVERLGTLVHSTGLVGVMSSGQASIADNRKGGYDTYRASKAALNQAMRSHAVRKAGDAQALILMAPGWVRTGVGGDEAPLEVGDVVPELVTTLISQQGQPGLRFIDRHGQVLPW